MPLREVRLYGALGREFGRVHKFDVSSPAEAIRALAANFRGFEAALKAYAPGFHLLAGRRDVADGDRMHHPAGASEPIKIVPAVAGAKGGLLSILAGVALIAAAFLTGGATLAGTTSLWGSMAIGFGASLVLGGVSQLIAPQKAYSAGSDDDEEDTQSYVFNGPVNTTTQGTPVPIGYGRMIVGSALVSMGITTEELPT